MLVLALPRDVVEAALPAVERRLARRPDGWSGLAARGKLRRLLGDRGGTDDLRRAAEAYLRGSPADPDLLTAANLHRLAGDDRAQELLERLRAQLLAETARAGTSSTRCGMLVDTCFLLGDDDGAQEALAAGVRDGQGLAGTRHLDVARLAAGRAGRDVALVDEAVAAFDRGAGRHLRHAVVTGGMDWHDWLEVGLVTRAQVSGTASDRLFEL